MAQQRDNVKAGIFVLAGIVLALAVIFALSDFSRMFEKRQHVQVYYTLTDGLQGLKTGATVTLGDQPVGEVLRIKDITQGERAALGLEPDTKDPQGASADPKRVVGKMVTSSIPSRYQIYEDAQVELNVPPLGSGTKLNFRSVGRTTLYDPSRSKPILGGVAGSTLTKNLMADAGIGDLQRKQIQDIIAHVSDITAQLKTDLPDITKGAKDAIAKAGQRLDDLKPALDNIKAITADVRKRKDAWFDNIDSITVNANDALKRVNQLLKDKDQRLREMVDHLHSITKRVDEETMTQVHDALAKADAALTDVKKVTEELRAFAVGQRPVLERAMANLSLTADQLKLAAIEVRRSPWRLLYKPSDEELNTDNIYDASRSFALAAGALDAASKSMATVAQQNPRDEAQINKMLEHLQSLFKRYQEAEDAFWKALQDRKPEGK